MSVIGYKDYHFNVERHNDYVVKVFLIGYEYQYKCFVGLLSNAVQGGFYGYALDEDQVSDRGIIVRGGSPRGMMIDPEEALHSGCDELLVEFLLHCPLDDDQRQAAARALLDLT